MTALSAALALGFVLAYDLARRYLARPDDVARDTARRIDELAKRVVALEAAARR